MQLKTVNKEGAHMNNYSTEELHARAAIIDRLYYYCRGIDRADEQALRSAYWPDGHDTHGSYVGDVEGFIQWSMGLLKNFERSIHQIHNILIEFQENGAAVESYFSAYQRSVVDGKRQQFFLMGRYVDWFEKRNDEWRIARRVVVFDWVEEQTPPEQSEDNRFGSRRPIGKFWPDDYIYRRTTDAD